MAAVPGAELREISDRRLGMAVHDKPMSSKGGRALFPAPERPEMMRISMSAPPLSQSMIRTSGSSRTPACEKTRSWIWRISSFTSAQVAPPDC